MEALDRSLETDALAESPIVSLEVELVDDTVADVTTTLDESDVDEDD